MAGNQEVSVHAIISGRHGYDPSWEPSALLKEAPGAAWSVPRMESVETEPWPQKQD